MIVDTAIQKAYLKATRKFVTTPSTDLPSAKYNALLAEADSVQKYWQSEEGVQWNSLRTLFNVGTVTATDTFALDPTIDQLSTQEDDNVTITNNGQTWYYDIVEAPRLRPAGNTTGTRCAKVGSNLVFDIPFTSSMPQFGGTIKVPAYLNVNDITAGGNVIQVDDPMWMVDMLAAFYVLNDKVRQGFYPDFVAQANSRMVAMKRANEQSQIEEVTNDVDLTTSGETWI